MDTTPTSKATPAPEKRVYDIERRKLQGAILESLKGNVREIDTDLGLLHNAEIGMRARLQEARRALAWAEHGVRPGTVVEWDGPSTSRLPPSVRRGVVVDSNPDYAGTPCPIVIQELKDGTMGAAKHTLHSYHDWRVVTE